MSRPAPTNGDDAPATSLVRDVLARATPDMALRPLLVVTDFDGTIAEIVLDPWGATILPAARKALRRLAALPGVAVVVLSGRTALDAASRVRVGGALYLGDHGVQRARLPRRARAGSLVVARDESLRPFAALAERVAAGVVLEIGEDWLVIEQKGPTVTFHYRAAPDVSAARERVAAAVEALDPERRFARFRGVRMLELRPPGAAAKGDAMRALIAEFRPAVAFVLGDDRSDALAFAALTEARRDGLVRGLAIGVHAHAEVPPEVAGGADVVLASPRDAAAFLSGLARRLVTPGFSG